MKKFVLMVSLFVPASLGAAGNPGTPAISTAAVATSSATEQAVSQSTAPPSVAITGETSGAPEPRAMTDRPGPGVFVTLTRTAVPDNDLPTSVSVVTPAEFKKFDAQNAGEAIAHETSMEIPVQGRQGAVQLAGIRGATSNQVLVLVDGRPIGGVGLSGSQDLASIPVEQIDHIEIVRGGVSALYGPNAMGGVINVITKRATYSGLPISHIGYEMAEWGRQIYRLDFGSRMGPLDYMFYGDEQWDAGFRHNEDDRTHTIGGNIGVSMGGAGKFLFDISSYHANADQPGELFPAVPTNQYNNDLERQAETPVARQITDTNYIRTSYLLPLPMDSMMTLRAYGSEREVQYSDLEGFFPSDSDRHEQTRGTEAQFSLPLGLLVGGNFVHDRLDSADHLTPANDFIAREENWGIFAQDTWNWKTLTVIPSGRFDHNSQAGDSKNPRVQLLEDTTPWLRFSGSAGRSFRAPTLDDLYTPFEIFTGGFSYQGNPNLLPETAWTYDAGFEVHVDSKSFQATYFRSNIHNLIQTTGDIASTTVNVGEARRQGAELEVRHVVNDLFEHRMNYTYLQNVGKPLGYDHFVALRLSPRHTVNYIATVTPIRKLSFDNTLQYISDRYEGNDRTIARIPGHFTWDLRATYEIRQLQIYAGLKDLLNQRFEDRDGFALPGRFVYGGLSLRLWG